MAKNRCTTKLLLREIRRQLKNCRRRERKATGVALDQYAACTTAAEDAYQRILEGNCDGALTLLNDAYFFEGLGEGSEEG